MRFLAIAAQASPGDAALRLMLARACERTGDTDLAWWLFEQVASESRDPAIASLATQGQAALPAPALTLETRLLRAATLDPALLAQARREAPSGETALSWLVRQDRLPFDRITDSALAGAMLPVGRPARERLGMRLLAERRISQGDLKQALSLQAHQPRPLGAILVAEFGLSPSVLQAVLQSLSPFVPALGPQDSPAALLMRWGALRREHWDAVRSHGPRAFDVLVAQGHVLPANVHRADTFRKTKQRLWSEGRFRLGEILIERGVIDRETLAKALAWQVDQPYRLGELLIRHRLASAERIAEGLLEQTKRYDAATESVLPPVEQPPPPVPVLPEAPLPRSRRLGLMLGLAGLTLIGAFVFATRYTRGDFGWLSAFNLAPQSAERQGPGVAELLGGSQSSGPRRERGTAFDPLDLPGSELSSQALGGAMSGERFGATSSERFIGGRLGDDFVGSPLPAEAPGGFVGESAGLEAVGTRSEANPVGTSGVTDSVTYGHQESAGARRTASRRSATSREAELQALNRVAYPMQDERHLPEAPTPAQGGTMQARLPSEGHLQAPIGLDRTVSGSPPESIQVRRDTAVFRLRLGRSLFERNDAASAREEFLSAIGLDPTLSPPHYFLGRIAEERGDREVAARWYRSYLVRSSGGEHSDEVRQRLERLPN